MRNMTGLMECTVGIAQVIIIIGVTIPVLLLPLCLICVYIGWVYYQYILVM